MYLANATKEATIMIAKSQFNAPASDAHERVRVPDGRIGNVLGFYRRQEESVLVLFSCGASHEYLTAEIETLPPGQ